MCRERTPLYWPQSQRQILVGASLVALALFLESVGFQLRPPAVTASMHREFLL